MAAVALGSKGAPVSVVLAWGILWPDRATILSDGQRSPLVRDADPAAAPKWPTQRRR